MERLKKLKKILFFAATPVILFLFLLLPSPTMAIDFPKIENPTNKLQVSIPGLKFSDPQQCGEKMCINWIGEYIAGVYNYAVAVVGIIATVVMMFGGLLWLTAGGDAGRISEAKAWITGSITGLVLMLTSYVILQQINPELVNAGKKPLELSLVEKLNLGDTEDPLDSNMDTTASSAKLLKSGTIAQIVASAIGNVTYGLNSSIKPGDCFGKGGKGPNGTVCFDCSGFAAYVLKSSKNITIGGGTGKIFENTQIKNYSAADLSSLPEGTLIGWKQGDGGKQYGHVFVAVGNGRFADSHGDKNRTPGGAIGVFSATEINKKYGSNGLRIKQYGS